MTEVLKMILESIVLVGPNLIMNNKILKVSIIGYFTLQLQARFPDELPKVRYFHVDGVMF